MKHIRFQVSNLKKLVLFFAILLCSIHVSSQDTLHLVYHHTQIKPHDSTEAKIDNWVKKLNGKHVEIQIVAYYHKADFKKFAQERVDELFLVLNRKAREQLKFDFYGTKKGSDEQRTTVDIIYKKILSPEEQAAAKAKEETAAKKAKEEEEAAKKAEKEKKNGDKTTDKDKKTSTTKAEDSGDKKEKKEGKEEKEDNRGDDWDDADYGQATTVSYGEGFGLSLEEAKLLKTAKFIVAQSGNKEVDDALFKAVKEYWNFNTNIIQMPYKEAHKMAKENKKENIAILSFMRVNTWFTQSSGPVKVKIRYTGYAVGIENAKGKTLVKQFFTKAKKKQPSYLSFSFAVSVINDLCNTMVEKSLPKAGKIDSEYDLRAAELKQKTLYIPESMMNPKLPRQEVPMYYKSSIEIVPDKKWEELILQKKEGMYVMIAMIPRPPKGFWYYIMDAKTGRVMYIDFGPSFQINGGWHTGSFDPSQSGYVDKANLEHFEKGSSKAIEDAQKREEKKEKQAQKESQKKTEKEAKEGEKEIKKSSKK